MNSDTDGIAKRLLSGLASTGWSLIKVGAVLLLLYVAGMSIFAISQYSTTKVTLLSHGISEATSSLLAWAVMLVAVGLPSLAVLRILFYTGRPYHYVAAMILPLISWAVAQIPANFDQNGAALKFCANRPDGALFCLDHAGVDPLTQDKLVPMNSSLAKEQFRRNKGLIPKRVTLPVSEIEFFDPLSGQAKVWVHENDQGCFDMFDNPGADPQSGEPLFPISKKVVHQIKECANGSVQGTNSNGATALPSEVSQQAVTASQSDCKVLPILNMNAMSIDSPYVGGCKDGLAEGQGSFTYRVREHVHSVKGEFRAGKLNGTGTITEPDRVIEGEFRENRLWNTVTKGVLPGGIRYAAQVRNGAVFAMCRADRQEENNCTDREGLLAR